MKSFLEFGGKLHLKHRQMIAVIGVSITILALATVAFFVNDYIASKRSLVENIKSKAVFIGANSSAALAFRDQRAADQALRIASMDESVILAVLYDNTSNVFAHFLRRGFEYPIPRVLPKEGISFTGDRATILEPVMIGISVGENGETTPQIIRCGT